MSEVKNSGYLSGIFPLGMNFVKVRLWFFSPTDLARLLDWPLDFADSLPLSPFLGFAPLLAGARPGTHARDGEGGNERLHADGSLVVSF